MTSSLPPLAALHANHLHNGYTTLIYLHAIGT